MVGGPVHLTRPLADTRKVYLTLSQISIALIVSEI